MVFVLHVLLVQFIIPNYKHVFVLKVIIKTISVFVPQLWLFLLLVILDIIMIKMMAVFLALLDVSNAKVISSVLNVLNSISLLEHSA